MRRLGLYTKILVYLGVRFRSDLFALKWDDFTVSEVEGGKTGYLKLDLSTVKRTRSGQVKRFSTLQLPERALDALLELKALVKPINGKRPIVEGRTHYGQQLKRLSKKFYLEAMLS